LGVAADWDLNVFLKIDGMLLSILLSLLVFLVLTLTHLTFVYFLRKGNWFAIRSNLLSRKILFWETLISVNEETWFRGAILLSLAASFGTIAAIIASSAFFSLIHIKSSIHSAVAALLMGLAFSFIMLSTQNIIGPICGHFLFNLVNSVLIGPPERKN